jgi:hypothetical protein
MLAGLTLYLLRPFQEGLMRENIPHLKGDQEGWLDVSRKPSYFINMPILNIIELTQKYIKSPIERGVGVCL